MIRVGYSLMRNSYMKFQNPIFNVLDEPTHGRTDESKPICPHFLKVGVIKRWLLTLNELFIIGTCILYKLNNYMEGSGSATIK